MTQTIIERIILWFRSRGENAASKREVDMLFRQGDVFLQKISAIPQEARASALPHGTLVHGEVNGHSHRLEDLATGRLFPGAATGVFFLEVTAPRARIVHEEHGPILLDQGFYRVWRQREYSPEAIRPVCD